MHFLAAKTQRHVRRLLPIEEQIHIQERLIDVEFVVVDDRPRAAGTPVDDAALQLCECTHTPSQVEVTMEHVALHEVVVLVCLHLVRVGGQKRKHAPVLVLVVLIPPADIAA